MQWQFRNLRVGAKLWAATGALVLAMTVVVGIAAVRAARVQAESDAALAQADVKLRIASSWSAMAETNVVRLQASMISRDGTVEASFKEVIEHTNGKEEAQRQLFETMTLNPSERAQLAQISAESKAMRDAAAGVRKHRSLGNSADAEAEAVFNPAAERYLLALGELVTAQEGFTASLREYYGEERKMTVRIAEVLLVLVVGGIFAGTVLLVRSIRAPLAEAVAVAERVAVGDLSPVAASERADEFGDLRRSLRRTVDQLSSMVGRIKQTSDLVSTASREIAQSNADLSQRTEEQASALEETSASMQQMTATVGQNAQNAQKANELAAQASGVAARGGAMVREVAGAMNGITASSKKIADIIGVIDGIAFQTNILALNAAVEAARAGEQGRGFAVVASEVRSLAQRSAAAAKQVKDLITDSVSRVDSGARQVNDAGQTMEEIVASVKKVTGLIAEITAASQEQAQGIGQVSDTMSQLEKVTQQNAAMVEQASAAAGSLEEQSKALSGAVAVFSLGAERTLSDIPAALLGALRQPFNPVLAAGNS